MKDAVRDTHPSFAVASFSRVNATPGVSLFDSEIRHRQFITLTVTRASRDRDLHHDWIHADGSLPLIEIAMSEAQFGALVSSFGNGTGVPVTLESVAGERIEEPPYAPRTAESMREIGEATDKLFEGAVDTVAKLQKAFDRNAGRTELRALIRDLSITIENSRPNTEYLAKTFTEHVETVVTKARADIEGMATMAATRGLGAGVADDVKALLP